MKIFQERTIPVYPQISKESEEPIVEFILFL